MNKQMRGTLYLIPAGLGGEDLSHTWPSGHLETIRHIRHFVVEKERTARRFLRQAGFNVPFDEIQFYPLNKHSPDGVPQSCLQAALEGNDIGMLSEAGCPGIADPGQSVALEAHRLDIRVVPLVGPSSILLALMASGFNGQQFVFHGYLPIEGKERIAKIREMERQTNQGGQTQIFMETPYRNNKLMQDLISTCMPGTWLCVACDLTKDTEYIRTMQVSQWKKKMPDLHKRTSIFLICRD